MSEELLKYETRNAVYVDIDAIKPNDDNPRYIRDKQYRDLERSIRRNPSFMEKRPVVVDIYGVIQGGNMRYRVCQAEGWKRIPIDVYTMEDYAKDLEASKAELAKEGKELKDDSYEAFCKAFVIKDNLSYGEWDNEMLGNKWDAEELEEFGMNVDPWRNSKDEAEEDDYTPPNMIEVNTTIKEGDLIEIGPHKLLCASSTDPENWSKIMGEQQSDMVLTDPPYNVDYTGKTKDALKIENDKKEDGDFYQFLFDFYSAQAEFVKAGAGWYVWHADMEAINFRKAFIHSGLKLSQVLIWAKNTMVMGRQDYHWQHEPCLYGWKEGAKHNWYSDRKQTTVLQFDRPTKSKEHPTMKPVPLIGYQISNSSKQGDLITDGFLGSGTTMLAAHQLQRKCYGMELDPKYCHVIVERMLKYDNSLIVKKNGKKFDLKLIDN